MVSVVTPAKWDVKVGLYAVAFLDLLGQRKAMKKISATFEEAFRKSPGLIDMNDGGTFEPAVIELRERVSKTALAIERFFASYEHLRACSKSEYEKFLATIKPEMRASIDAATRPTIHFSRLSDGLVLFMRIRSDAGRPAMGALLSLVNECASLFLDQIAEGNPVRGGIDVGVGADVTRLTGDIEIYGPAFLSAYELESETAKYPRIAVGQGLLDLLKEVTEDQTSGLVGQIEKKAGRLIAERLYRSPDDSVMMIDVLGKSFTKNPLGMDRETVAQARSFVAGQVKQWAADPSEEGRELHGRYLKLTDYFDRRMYLWQ
jgi:hypothetical protein